MNILHFNVYIRNPLNKRFFHSSSANFINSDSDSDSDVEPLNTESMSKEAIEDNIKKTISKSTKVRQDLSYTTNILDRLSRSRISDLTRLDPQEASNMQSKEIDVSSCYREARNTSVSSKERSDKLNEYTMRKGMLSVFKSEHLAAKFNVRRSDEEIETVTAANNLISDLRQLRENMFSLWESENNINQSVSDSSNSNEPKRSIVDDYSKFDEVMPDYGVGGSEE